ncbi:hypothetical protein WSS15_20700 [Acetobacter pasteurianus]|uniref:hypothetical protein n=1 Tax=Acetobacter pasteurianus TaxID=438 RepID=UPI0022C9E0CE|nr:hypothetical protein [Acetobacter pasteurianus]GLH29420.1 hypothetical protein WSS15_20700 [Acetobacter pasteurianus]
MTRTKKIAGQDLNNIFKTDDKTIDKNKHDDFEEDVFEEDDDIKFKKDDLISVFSDDTKDQINEYIRNQKSYYSDYRKDKNITFDELKKEVLIRYFYDNYVQKKTTTDRIENLFKSIEDNKNFIKFVSIASLISINLFASLKFLLKRK